MIDSLAPFVIVRYFVIVTSARLHLSAGQDADQGRS